MSASVAAFDRLLELLALIAILAIGIMLAQICIDVAARVFGFRGLAGGILISEYALYILAFCGAPRLLRDGAHISVDLLAENLPAAQARVLVILCDVLGFVVMALLTWYGARVVLETWRDGTMVYNALVFETWLILWPMPLATLCMATEFLLRLIGLRSRSLRRETVAF